MKISKVKNSSSSGAMKVVSMLPITWRIAINGFSYLIRGVRGKTRVPIPALRCQLIRLSECVRSGLRSKSSCSHTHTVGSVLQVDGGYKVKAIDGRVFNTANRPLLAGGFDGGHKLVADLFEQRDDGFSRT